MTVKPLIIVLFATSSFCAATTQSYGQTPKPKWRPTVPSKPDHRPVASGVRGLAPVPQTDELMAEPERTRGAITNCLMTFENMTGYFVDVWYDNVYQGRISPWQEGTTLGLGSNYKTFTAQTVGKTLEWTGNIECGGTGSLVPK